MDEDMKGTNRQLAAKIKDHMEANPVLRANPRFSALYGVRARKAATSVAKAGEEEQSAREPVESEEESEEETDSEYEESKNEKDKKKKKKKREKAKWSAEEDADLVAVLREQQRLGNQADSGWKPIVWTVVVAVLEKNHKDVKRKTMKQVLTHFGNLKGDYAVVKKLCGLSGFGWDDAKMVVTASPEVWDKYLEGNNKHTKWRSKEPGLPDTIYSIQCSSEGPDDTTTAKESDSDVEEVKETGLKRGKSVELPPMPPNKKRRTATAEPDAIKELAGSVALLAEAIVDSDKALAVGSSLDPSPVRHTKAYQRAEEEEGFSDTDLADAAEVFEDTKVVDAYLAFKKLAVRTQWLRRKLNKLNPSL
ncbi:hypothetical protein M422DRAFT_247606 [Sphaerobolus stellatus SS14]|nr:hypothetical protein M422DRAFT_247606 [Sphaerobolus stellatus SS14]